MSAFTIRIELHSATWQHYINLAADLARFGITDVIKGDNGVFYKMSPGEYNYQGAGSIDDVYATAKGAADRTGKMNAVFVTEAMRRKWGGLPVVQERRSA